MVSIISIVILLIIVGFALYLIESFLPLDATIKKLIYAVVIFAVVLWLLSAFGLLSGLNGTAWT